MNKVYTLAHIHKFDNGYVEDKLIGTFDSEEKALETLENYKNLKGFRDNLDGFYIQECKIDEINTKALNKLINQYKEK
ncbi:hypothetical protein HQ584_07145 [Patescibacteria group bacterium]|nr:hypothetical protein [Patescibacteria group bacterium]